MDKIEAQVTPAPPDMIASLREGFDAVSNQVAIILIPITIDLLLWLGPHLQLKTLLNNLVSVLTTNAELTTLQPGDLFSSSIEAFHAAAAQFNLLILLRTIPVGIPSLMASRLPLQIPTGSPLFFDVTNIFSIILISIALMLVGSITGSFYYIIITQVALNGRVELKIALKNWWWTTLQVLTLAFALIILFVVVSIPSSCAISIIGLFGLPLSQFAIFLYIGVLLWLAFPLIFSAHGIFVNHNNALVSVQKSMMLTRMTLPTTAMFIIMMLAISEGLNILWRVPPENSWLILVGLGGHAFIATSLLASSFVYYRDADQWVQNTIKMIKAEPRLPLNGS